CMVRKRNLGYVWNLF
ncbi:hypothetical protein ACTFIY_004503, partial [Dictyostelium cf. discoideum]